MRTAVISGGAGGLGRALSAGLRAGGWRVALLDLEVAGLEETGNQLPLACDLTDAASLAAAMARLAEWSGNCVDLAVYNAGITQIGAFAESDAASHRRVFEINYFAAVEMARALLAPVRAAGGTHLAISSVAGFSPLYHRTAYAASKHALEGFFGSLRSEERTHGVHVAIAAPSFVATNIGNDQRQADGIARPGSAGDGMDYMTPDQAAAEILRGLARRRPFIPVGRVARLSWRLNRLSPRLFQRLMERSISGH
ncbi:SDR family NAD(P)-dependent oxidoreductase [Pseudodonghicola flavimaris]|uniref:SDR family NAD(P)-dependent oxidoreductase n=1 Tax=Pseudodonghicola flavimaris TaxID=3050036 RepID=A0ABT7EY00_9RHOB|nr:SDR family NAD(P)-dependent oxidoreductase [Pseudodonghicola flavimaris]MDK3017213.1 SDR family NAD(P)-dependent oxidoreductase [Pseudodonghicola flavimaris]